MTHGGTLESFLEPGREVPRADILGILLQVARELDDAHARGSTQGYLDPAGIHINDYGAVTILETSAPHSDERLFHALDYLSPEFLNDAPLDGRSGQFSLAVLAYRMLTGALPFAASSPIGVIFRIAFPGVERSSMPALPAGAQSVLLRALSRNPRERYSSCREMVEALGAAVTARPVAAPTRLSTPSWPAAIPAIPQPPRPESRSSLPYFLVAFVVCLSLFGVLVYWLMPKPPARPVVTVAPVQVQAPPAPAPVPVVKPRIIPQQPVAPARKLPPRVPAVRIKPVEPPEPEPPPPPLPKLVEPKVSRP